MFDLYLLLASDDAETPDHASPAPGLPAHTPSDRADDAAAADDRTRYHASGDGDTVSVAIAA